MVDYDGVFSHLCVIGRTSGAALSATRGRQYLTGHAVKNKVVDDPIGSFCYEYQPMKCRLVVAILDSNIVTVDTCFPLYCDSSENYDPRGNGTQHIVVLR